MRSASHRGGFRPAQPAGGTGPEDSRIATSRGHRQGVSGAAAAECGPRASPVPCGTTCPYGPPDPPPTEGGTSWRAVNSLTRRWSAKMLHGCWRGSPPTILMRLSKNRSVSYGFNGRGDFTASATFRPTREVVTGLVPGSYRSTGSLSASSWGHQGIVKRGPTPGQLPAPPATGLNTRGGSLGLGSGFHTVAGRGSA